MSPELEQRLYLKYPVLFERNDLPASETCMCWGICCGDGWYNIIDDLCKKISKYEVRIEQVKEKFGTLRVYFDHTEKCDDESIKEILGWLQQAEAESSITCEETGQPGKRRKVNGWIRVITDEKYIDYLEAENDYLRRQNNLLNAAIEDVAKKEK